MIMKMKATWILKGIAIGAAFVVIGGLAVMTLWNWLMPAIFGLKVISFLQALGLFALSKILFGGFRSRGGWRERQHFWKNKMAERGERWKGRSKEDWKKYFEGETEEKV